MFRKLIDDIKIKIEHYKDHNLSLFLTSSFQTQSVPLLHIMSIVDRNIPVYFIDTGFLFHETYAFRDRLATEFNLNVIIVRSPIPHSQQFNSNGQFHYCTDTDYCCYMNKVLPMDSILQQHDIWINGVRADQTDVRKNFATEGPAKYGVIRYHPMLEWNAKMVYEYIRQHKLPKHPLEEKGYVSIGCVPCTDSWSEADGRTGRWAGLHKTECGLHTQLK